MTTGQTVTIEVLALDRITPYWRNPRKIDDAGIDKLVHAIETYGYQQPIVVDTDHVIITGHSRYQALRRLGWTEAAVIVSDLDSRLAQEYRVLDNKLGENSEWDSDKLLLELREFITVDALDLHFPEIDLGIDYTSVSGEYDADDMATAAADLEARTAPVAPTSTTARTIHCPHCFQPIDLQP